MQIKGWILFAVACYGVMMLAISLYWMRKVKKTSDFLMAHRNLGFLPLLGTVLATGIGTGVSLGASGLAYRSGWGGCVYPIGLGVGIMITALFANMRNYNFMTLSEEIACYYGGNPIIYNFTNVTLFLSKICWLSVQIMGGGFVLSVITGLNINTCTVIAGVLIAITTIPGGLLTVVYTDIFQVIILLCGFILLCFVSLHDVGGFAGLRQKIPAENFSFLGVEALGWKTVVSIFAALIIHMVSDTNNRHRIYSASSPSSARRAIIAAGIFEIGFAFVITIIGMSVYALNPDLPASDQAITWLTVHALPTWLAAIVVVATTAAIFSSGDSDAAVSATFFIRHIYPMIMKKSPSNPLKASRILLSSLFIVSTLLALIAGNIVDFVIDFLAIVLSGISVVIILGRFWPRATWQGGVAAIIVGAVVSVTVKLVPGQEEFWGKTVIPATLAALLCHVVISLLTPATKISFKEVVEKMRVEREDLDK